MKTEKNVRGDLETITDIELDPSMLLRISTHKTSNGLKTTAQVYHRSPTGMLCHTMAMFSREALESDFRLELHAPVLGRATASKLEKLHVQALGTLDMEALKARALAHQQDRKAFQAKTLQG